MFVYACACACACVYIYMKLNPMKSISVVKEAANISVRESKASFWNPCLETGQSVSETELSWRTGLSPILALIS